MAEVFAGLLCGYGLALVYTPLMAIALLRARVTSPTLGRMVPEGTSLVVISIFLHTFALFAFTAIGMLFGLLLYGFESSRPAGGLGSPSGAYTALTLGVVAIAVIPLALVAPRLRAPLISSGLLIVGVFGWLVPYLALLRA